MNKKTTLAAIIVIAAALALAATINALKKTR
jgi:hypothetical protein